jgi:TPR repeat protein
MLIHRPLKLVAIVGLLAALAVGAWLKSSPRVAERENVNRPSIGLSEVLPAPSFRHGAAADLKFAKVPSFIDVLSDPATWLWAAQKGDGNAAVASFLVFQRCSPRADLNSKPPECDRLPTDYSARVFDALRTAALAGHAQAQFHFARAILHKDQGPDTPVSESAAVMDRALALRLLEQLASNRSSLAALELAQVYSSASRGEPDYTKAYAYALVHQRLGMGGGSAGIPTASIRTRLTEKQAGDAERLAQRILGETPILSGPDAAGSSAVPPI